MRRPGLVLAIALVLPACDRTEEPRGSRPASVSVPHSPAPPASEAQPEPPAEETLREETPNDDRCIVPLSDQPPPSAKPAAQCPPDPGPRPQLPHGQVVFIDAPDQPTVSVEWARTPAEKARGLMYRRSMPANDGMLFSWTEEAPRSFWMRNTCIPLDMLAIAADGTINAIVEQAPTLNDLARRMPCPAAHVLEVNAGWVRSHGVRPGQKVRIDT